MDIYIPDSGMVDKYENVLIHFFYHILDIDYRNALFTDESSIYDMGSTGLNKADYVKVAQEYAQLGTDSLDYFAGEKAYNKILNAHWDKVIHDRIHEVYGIDWDLKVHLLTDIAMMLEDQFPDRNWEEDIIFVIKMLDNRMEKEEKKIEQELAQKQDEKVVKLQVRKKLTPDEVRACTNEFLMVRELGIPMEEARTLARANWAKKKESKKFEPYIPENDD